MSVVKINAITVPAERAEQLSARFAARAGEVGKSDGFEEFQLLRPTDERTTWLVYTRWRDEASFQAWMASQAFGQAHGQPAGPTAGQEGGNHSGGEPPVPPPSGPVATGAELWNYHVEQREAR
ncbi:MAG TPA: antibiotic biosynthesis monooxygenase family protein [Acidimicrobiales bacterium]|nr:antibiotic biosynthesis monooxygenase family protein [Acidimicrobiales bacterium]